MLIEELEVPIIDGHAHIASTDFMPQSFVEGIVDNILVLLAAQGMQPKRQRVYDMYLKMMQDPLCDQLVAQMDAANIAQTVLLLPDFTYALRDSELTIAEMFARHRAVLDRHPGRFYVLAGADPRWGKDSIDLFEKGIREYGFHGLKLYPPCGYGASDEALFPFYEICRDHHLPVLIHTGGTSPALSFDTARPIVLDSAARRFPDVNFILAHASTSYSEECAMMCGSRPNVYVDISGYEARPIGHLKRFFDYGVNHKTIFGTDWPVFRMQGTQASFVGQMFGDDGPVAQLRSYEIDRFFHGTIRSLLPNREDDTSHGASHEK